MTVVCLIALSGWFTLATAQDVQIAADGSAEITHAPTGEPQRSIIATPTAAVQSARLEAAGYRGGATLLYSGGSFVTCTDCVGEGAEEGDGSVLQNSTLGMNSLGFNTNLGNFTQAQPFVVPAGGWTLDLVHTYAYDTGSDLVSSQTGVYIRIWDGHPDDAGSSIVFGDMETNRMVSTEWSGVYRVSQTSPTLTNRPIMVQTSTVGTTLAAGEYWFEWAGTAFREDLARTPWAPPVNVEGVCLTGQAWTYANAADAWERRLDGGSGACAQAYPLRFFGTGTPSTAFAPSTLSLSASFLADGAPDLRAGDPVQSFTIRNMSAPDFNWNIVESAGACVAGSLPWVSASPTSGTTAEGMTSEVTVTFDPSGLPAGTYTGELCIEGNAATDAVSVRMTLVDDQEVLLLVPDVLTAARNLSVLDGNFGTVIAEGFGPYSDVFTAFPWGVSVNFTGTGYFLNHSTGASAPIQEFDGSGNYVGEFALPGGTPRGMHLTPDGQHLAVAEQTNNSIVLINDQGVVTGHLIAPGANGLSNPADFVIRDTDILVVSSGNNAIWRYDLSGNFLDVFYDDFGGSITAGQMIQAENGNIILVVTSLIAQRGIYEFLPNGTLHLHGDPVTSPMGVYELPSGNLLVSRNGSIEELDRATFEVVATHRDEGNNRFILPVPEEMITFPPLATFDPAEGIDITVAEGQMATESFMIGNAGDLDLEFGPITGQTLPDPSLDEALAVDQFTISGNGTHTTTATGGVATQGPVTGFTFTGTVTGVGGTGTWASDMSLTLTAPDDQTYSVGGFASGYPPWDYQGAGSTEDGTYTSTHQGVFADASDVGTWTFFFEHHFGSGADMTWSDVTVTLHKAGEDFIVNISPESGTVMADGSVSVDVTVDADGFALGTYHAELHIPTNESAAARAWWTPEEFETFDEERREGLLSELAAIRTDHMVHVYPISMEVVEAAGPPVAVFTPPVEEGLEETLAPGESTTATMSIGNAGDENLEFDFTEFSGDAGRMLVWRDSHDASLDEPFDLGSLPELTSPASHTVNVTGGVATQGPVVGFSFQGTVVMTGGAWASDTRLTITSPDGQSHFVGGFPAPGDPINHWDFQGADSAPDGTYSSSHFGIFDNAQDAGEWTFLFEQTWGTATWTDVTITLHKGGDAVEFFVTDVSPAMGTVAPGGSMEVSVTFDAMGLDVGTYSGSLTIATNEEDNGRGGMSDFEFARLSADRQAVLAGFVRDVSYDYPVTLHVQEPHASILGYWAFNDGGTNPEAWPPPIDADEGTLHITHNFTVSGTNGHSSFAGTDLNALEGYASGGSFVPQGEHNNGNHFTIVTSSLGFEDDLQVSYATQRTATGFTSQAFEYSIDGGTSWTALETITDIPSSFAIRTVELPESASDQSDLQIRVTLTGASSASGNNRFDNLRVEVVPEEPGPPVAQFTPPSLDVTLEPGESTTETMMIANTGESVLEFDFVDFNGGLLWNYRPVVDAQERGETLEFPMGYDRASGIDVRGSASAVVAPFERGGPIAGDWNEGFEDITTLPAAGWAMQNNSSPVGSTGWFQGNADVFPAHQGPENSYIGANFNNTTGSNTISNWLMTPEIVLANGTELTFYARAADGLWSDRLQVRMSTSGSSTNVGTTATSVGDFTELMLDINPTYAQGVFLNEWVQYTVTVSGLPSTTSGRLAFRYFVENGGPAGANSDFIGIDTVSLTQPDGDPPAMFVTAVSPAAGTVDPGSSVEISVTFDATGFEEGTYNDNLTIETNEPSRLTTHEYPVSMTVEEGVEPGTPIATFTPPIEEGIEETLDSGETTTATLTIGNVGDASLTFDFAGFRDAHVPALDEDIDVAGFTIQPGAFHTATGQGGVQTQGQVVGFTFEGTVSGISGTGTWASDMQMTITSPDGQSFFVGGFPSPGGANNWDFQGAGSTNDGTYMSTHFVFDEAQDVGEWTFMFEHQWGSGEPMTWSDVTVTLHKGQLPFVTGVDPASGTVAPGGSVDVTVSISAEGLNEGSYTSFLEIVTNEPSNMRLWLDDREVLSAERMEALANAPVRETTTYLYPVTLNVEGEAGCVIEPDPIAFGEVIVGFDATMMATVTNEGSAACALTAATTDEDDFTVDFEPVTLQPGQSADFSVTFAPSSVGSITGTLTLTSDNGDVTASLTGTGVAAPQASVDPDNLHFEVLVGETDSQTFTLSNLAAAGAADLEFSISVAAARPFETEIVAIENAGGRGMNGSGLSTGDGSTPDTYVVVNGRPVPMYRGGEMILTHSLSQNIVATGVGIMCPTPPTRILRVFDLAEFEVGASFEVTEVGVGIREVGTGGAGVTNLRLHRLDGPLTMANLELVAEASFDVSAADQQVIRQVAISAMFEGDDVMVVEWHQPRANIFFGGNSAGETGPTYIQADNCTGTEEPVTAESIGFPGHHWVLNVHGIGTTGMLTVEPTEGSVAAGESEDITVTVDATDVEEGEYTFEILVQTNDPDNPVLVVDVTVEVTKIGTEGTGGPLVFGLEQNYPNPFTAQTTIEYSLAEPSAVRIDVYDVSGRRVTTLVNGELEAGRHTATWDANGVASGMYFYRIQAGTFTKTMRAMVVR